MHTHAHTHAHNCTYTHAYTLIHICTHVRTHTHPCIHTHARTHTHTYTHTHTHTHTHTYTHTHTHTQSTLNCSPNATDITGRAELNIINIIQLLMIYTIMNSSLRAYNTFSKPLSLRCCVILAVVWIIPEYCRTQPLMLP